MMAPAVASLEADAPTVNELIADLHVLARITTVARYRYTVFPALARLRVVRTTACTNQGSEHDALPHAFREGLVWIENYEQRCAAAVLFGFHDSRWVTLGARQRRAAAALGICYDTYRRRGDDGRSHFDATILEFATALAQLDRSPPTADRLVREYGSPGTAPALSPATLRAAMILTSHPIREHGVCRFAIQLPENLFHDLEEFSIGRGVTVAQLLLDGIASQISSAGRSKVPPWNP